MTVHGHLETNQDDAGNNIPIGVFEMNYEPSHLLSNMTALMIREVLGFHAQVDPKMGSGGDTFLWALAGCTDFNDGASRTCGTQETTIHVSVDSWLGGYTLTQNELAAKYPQLAPEDLGSMGYSGQNSIFVSQAVHTAAYSDSGLALDHYRSCSERMAVVGGPSSHAFHLRAPCRDARAVLLFVFPALPKGVPVEKYFDSVQDVDLSELAMCSGADMIMNNNNVMKDYLKYSGDAEGVELQADGSYIAKCWNDRWWYAPACRQDASTCIPVFTAGTGWFLQAIMQWSTAYGIPAAIGVSGGWQLWQKHVRTFRALHYGWLPDSTFADMLPLQVVFPPHNAQEWAAGDQKTASESVHIAKMVSSNLKSKAGRVRELTSPTRRDEGAVNEAQRNNEGVCRMNEAPHVVLGDRLQTTKRRPRRVLSGTRELIVFRSIVFQLGATKALDWLMRRELLSPTGQVPLDAVCARHVWSFALAFNEAMLKGEGVEHEPPVPKEVSRGLFSALDHNVAEITTLIQTHVDILPCEEKLLQKRPGAAASGQEPRLAMAYWSDAASPELRCPNHPEEESDRESSDRKTKYCEECYWALQVLEAQATYVLDPREAAARLDVRHWPRASELGPEVAFERRELQHARALLVRVDVNVLDLLDVYQELKDSWKQQSLQVLIMVCNNLITEIRSDGEYATSNEPTKSSSLNELQTAGSERLLELLGRILQACEELQKLIGERFHLGELPKRWKGLQVEKENHMGLIVTTVYVYGSERKRHSGFECLDSAGDAERLRHLPFHGIIELVKTRRQRAHHDQRHCRGCDFLGRMCGASKTKSVVEMKVLRHGRSSSAATREALVRNILKEVEREMRRMDPSVTLQWKSRTAYASEAVVRFFQGELPYQICERAKHVVQRRLEECGEAETTVRAEFEGEAPGILYVADFQGDMDSPYTAEEVRRVARRPGCECLGWFSEHPRFDVPKIRLISAPHWLKKALKELPRINWQLYRLTLPVEVFELTQYPFRSTVPERVHDVDRMRVSPVESLDRPAEVFESYAGGLLKMGTFPLRAIPYVHGKFCDELENQWQSLFQPQLRVTAVPPPKRVHASNGLRHVYLFGKPTSAQRQHAANDSDRDDDDHDSAEEEDEDEDSASLETPTTTTVPADEPNRATPAPSTLPEATQIPEMPKTPGLGPAAPVTRSAFPAAETQRLHAGRARAAFRADDFQTRLESVARAIWRQEDVQDGWCKALLGPGFRKDIPGKVDGCAPDRRMPLTFQAEILSNGFAGEPMATGGTCDVHQVELPGRVVAAKVLHNQESKAQLLEPGFGEKEDTVVALCWETVALGTALVCAMHDPAQLFQQEVQALRRLSHPNIAMMLDSGVTSDGRFLIIEEFVSTQTLLECLDGIDSKERINVAVQLAAAIKHVHDQGMIHRDVKSSNVLVDVDAVGNLTTVKLRVCKSERWEEPGSALASAAPRGIWILTASEGMVAWRKGGAGDRETDHYKDAKKKKISFHWSWPKDHPRPTPRDRSVTFCADGKEWEGEPRLAELRELAASCVAEFSEDRPEMAMIQRPLKDLADLDRSVGPSDAVCAVCADVAAPLSVWLQLCVAVEFVNPTVGGNGGSQVFALAGCTDFNDKANMECGTQETTIHVSVDSWIGSYASTQNQFAKEYPRLAAEDLGSMGYAGEESMYVSRAILQAAYSESGLALDFYKSYNTTHHDPKKYFGSIHDVDLSELALCNETDLSDRNQMSDYAKYSGDYDGVVNQSDGTFVAKCTNDRWWYAPACRHNASTCIPVFTAGTGWKAQPMMQWSTAYGIPAALAVSGAWSLFLQHVRTFRALHYWWVPDSTFIEMLPEQLLFARHSANEWLAGDKKTGGQGSYVSKMVSQNLQSKAPKVKNFVRMINFELPELQDLLLEWRQTGSKSDVACRWLKENQDRWKAWIPDDTNCLEGFGVVDENQAFLNSREGAVSCGLCTPGRSSQEVEDDKGKTYRCAECEPGESQAQSFSTSCEKCPKGTMSHAWGSIMCEPCGQGFYQDSVGHSMCKACPAGRTTKLLGATGLKGCVCQAGSIEEEGQCVPCGTGIACPLGSTLEDLKSNNDSDPNLPRVEPGFVSHWSSPLQTFRCRGSACPGGAPGSCSAANR
ncbi:LEAF RUST 10 DISEASE-RESISTANCE LOCUS RECEPTOR-LIKE PROTEIN KINASE-like 1.4 (Probable receptor-like serine/threonine-protein kinase LRK10L-1.4), partial [Durusdinium trenchii]